jgi:hypothetical protein
MFGNVIQPAFLKNGVGFGDNGVDSVCSLVRFGDNGVGFCGVAQIL